MKRKFYERASRRVWAIGRYKIAAAKRLCDLMGLAPQDVLNVHLMDDSYLCDLTPMGSPLGNGKVPQ